eukprot:GHVS01037326.1.p1 GENE.GHVS01037326.1~~GHVS01037326.1.p1  ORF type:complete len:212 (+),score=42.02 GHVS01037326.1:50-685(+)
MMERFSPVSSSIIRPPSCCPHLLSSSSSSCSISSVLFLLRVLTSTSFLLAGVYMFVICAASFLVVYDTPMYLPFFFTLIGEPGLCEAANNTMQELIANVRFSSILRVFSIFHPAPSLSSGLWISSFSPHIPHLLLENPLATWVFSVFSAAGTTWWWWWRRRNCADSLNSNTAAAHRRNRKRTIQMRQEEDDASHDPTTRDVCNRRGHKDKV